MKRRRMRGSRRRMGRIRGRRRKSEVEKCFIKTHMCVILALLYPEMKNQKSANKIGLKYISFKI